MMRIRMSIDVSYTFVIGVEGIDSNICSVNFNISITRVNSVTPRACFCIHHIVGFAEVHHIALNKKPFRCAVPLCSIFAPDRLRSSNEYLGRLRSSILNWHQWRTC